MTADDGAESSPSSARSADVAALVHRAAAGDARAWDELVDRFAGLIWSVARAHRLDEGACADVVQTTWLRLLEHLDRIREPQHVGSWLATTARHECLRLIRIGQRERPTEDVDLDRPDAALDELDAALLARERDVVLHRAVDQLPDRCRRLLRVLVADPPPSYAEVSAALEMPVGSIGPTRERCLRRLRGLIGPALAPAPGTADR